MLHTQSSNKHRLQLNVQAVFWVELKQSPVGSGFVLLRNEPGGKKNQAIKPEMYVNSVRSVFVLPQPDQLLRLTTPEAVPLQPLHAFITWTGHPLPFTSR